MILNWAVRCKTTTDGQMLIEPEMALGPYPERITDSLDFWAAQEPERVFLAERNAEGWRAISYKDFRHQARATASGLLKLGLSAERPIAILSGNDIEHAVLGIGAMYAGIPFSPISPAYSLVSSDFDKLGHVFRLLTPGLIYAKNKPAFARALAAAAPGDAQIIDQLPLSSEGTLPAGIQPDHIAKILFTSGSAGVPKGVITTHRMLTSNQEMLRTVFPFLRSEPLVVCDWLPWNHTFGGSHNFGLVLYNGGTLYLDKGRPVTGAFDETVRNLRDIAPTVYFNVPKGFEMLVDVLRGDAQFRDHFYSRLQMTFYAGAGLSHHTWNALDELATLSRGAPVPMLTGLGATETAPFAVCANAENAGAGVIGLPVPGVRIKLVPVGDKQEIRVKGPNVTPGFWREPDLTRSAFDEDGYYKLGDAVRFVDPQKPSRGLLFDGRIAEDFKLATGTWVSVGPLRTQLVLHFAPYLRDAVIAGHDRDEVTALLIPDPEQQLTPELAQQFLTVFAAKSTGSANCVARAIVLAEPLSLDAGELTDKGSINQGAVLRRRSALVELLYAKPLNPQILQATLDS